MHFQWSSRHYSNINWDWVDLKLKTAEKIGSKKPSISTQTDCTILSYTRGPVFTGDGGPVTWPQIQNGNWYFEFLFRKITTKAQLQLIYTLLRSYMFRHYRVIFRELVFITSPCYVSISIAAVGNTIYPFKDEAQTALFKDTVHTEQ